MENKTFDEMRAEYADINNALWFATKAHKGQKRKDNKTPYIEHPLEVAQIVCTLTQVPSVVEAALLHDTVEDTDVRINDIARIFGAYVADLVADETENKRRSQPALDTWHIRKEEGIRKIAGAGADAKMISLADKLSNLRAIKSALEENGEVIWTWFHNPSVSDQAWYYRTMRDQYIGLKSTDAWKEYAQLVDEIFGGRAGEEISYSMDLEDLEELVYDDDLSELNVDRETDEEIDESPLEVGMDDELEY